MERKLILILLSSILFAAGSLALGIGYLSLQRIETMYRQNIADIQKLLVNKFTSFDTLMLREEQPLNRAIRENLPKLLDDLLATGKPLTGIKPTTLSSHAAAYHFDEVYLLNRAGVVVNTTFTPDLGLDLKGLNAEMARHLENIYGKGKVFFDRVSASVKTGAYNKYAYYSPRGTDYILEISVDLGDYIARTTSVQYRDFLFGDFFGKNIEAIHNLVEIDLFILHDGDQWSLLRRGNKMPPGIAQRLHTQHKVELRDGELLIAYQKFTPQTQGTDYTYDVVSRVSYRLDQLAGYQREIIVLSGFFLLAAVALAFLFGSRFLKSSLITPLNAISSGIDRIGEQEQVVAIARTGERELDHIVDSINAMQEKIVRRGKRLVALAESLEARVTTRTEQYRQAKETAEIAVKSRDRFLSLLSHDIKSPLAHTRHVLGLLGADKGKLGADERRAMTKRAERSVTALLGFIDALFDLSRIQAGYTKITPRFLHLQQVVSAQIDVSRSLAKDKGIVLRNDVPEKNRVFADPVLFGQVLQNLLSNAIKFSNSGGTVRIFAPDDATSLAIADQGIGIANERIGELFSSADIVSTQGTAGEQGTGMGLAYSHEIIKAHGGEITVTSTPGSGSTFRITLPAATLSAVIIDDQAAHRRIVKHCLRGIADIACLEYETAEEALEAIDGAEPEQIALILCDICMPGMDGWKFLRHYQTRQAGRHTPVVLVSSNFEGGGESGMRERALARGASDFIQKPFDEKDVQARTRRFFG